MKNSKFLVNKSKVLSQKFSFEIANDTYEKHKYLQKKAETIGVKLVVEKELAKYFEKFLNAAEKELEYSTEDKNAEDTKNITPHSPSTAVIKDTGIERPKISTGVLGGDVKNGY